jgi:hypothetical protein
MRFYFSDIQDPLGCNIDGCFLCRDLLDPGFMGDIQNGIVDPFNLFKNPFTAIIPEIV